MTHERYIGSPGDKVYTTAAKDRSGKDKNLIRIIINDDKLHQN